MSNCWLVLLPIILLILVNKNNVERFNNETCDITDNKIKLLEEKIKLESQQSKNAPNQGLTDRLNKIDGKLLEMNDKIIDYQEDILNELKLGEGVDKEGVDKEGVDKEGEEEMTIKEEEELYSDIINWNTNITDNYLVNALFIFFIILLIITIIYVLYGTVSRVNLSNKKVGKININYDTVIDEIKKNKIKDSIKIKKGAFFSFLDKKK